VTTFNVTEHWTHEPEVAHRTWTRATRYRPCSIVTLEEELTFSKPTLNSFVASAQINGTTREMCEVIQTHCVGEHQQFNSTSECEIYHNSLPLYDPACLAIYGEFSAEGESFMCKYLHHAMISLSPHLHCFHTGPGHAPDAEGQYKCHASQCRNLTVLDITAPIPPQPARCSEETVLALEESTMLALPFCLEALFEGNCTANCTQALNTFFSAFSVVLSYEPRDDMQVAFMGGQAINGRTHRLRKMTSYVEFGATEDRHLDILFTTIGAANIRSLPL
jgi:hypothetical protein